MCPDNATEKGSPGLADANAAVTGDLGHDVPAAGGNGVLRWEGGKPGAEAGPACGDTSVPCVFLWASGAFGTSEARTQTHWLLLLHPREMFLSKSIKTNKGESWRRRGAFCTYLTDLAQRWDGASGVLTH